MHSGGVSLKDPVIRVDTHEAERLVASWVFVGAVDR